MLPPSPPSEKGPKKGHTHIPYKPLTSSPLNPSIPSQNNGPPATPNPSPPRPKFKLPRAASPRKWLLRQKATSAMRASELRRGFFSSTNTNTNTDMAPLIRPGRSDSESESGSESGHVHEHEHKHQLGRFSDGEDGDIGLFGAGVDVSVGLGVGLGVGMGESRPLKPLPLPIPPRPRTPLGPGTSTARCLPRNGDGNGDFEVVDIVGVGPARGVATRQLLMRTEAGTVMAFPVRRRPGRVAISPILFLLGLACVVGLVPCLLRAFTPSSGTVM